MKVIQSTLILYILSIAVHLAAPEARQFSMDVKTDGKASYKGDSITQTRSLEISLSRAGKEAGADLVVQWTIYGHLRKDHNLVVLKKGDMNVSLSGGEKTAVTTPTVTIKGVRKHKKTTRRGRRRRTTTVPASGHEYYGYSVRLLSGTTMLAEAYSKPSLKSAK